MQKQKILIERALEPEVTNTLRRAGLGVDVIPTKGPDLAERLGTETYVGLIVSGYTRITARELDAAGERLRVVGVLSDTLRNIDVSEATRRGIVVKVIEFGNAYQVANLAKRMILFMLSKDFENNPSDGAYQINQVRSIVPSRYTGFEIAGKTIGVLGCGSVGQALAQEVVPYCRRVIGYDYDFPSVYRRFHVSDPLQRPVIDYCPLSEVMQRSDIISIHTRGWVKVFKDEKLRDLTRKPYIVETARDSFVSDKLLSKALHRGKVRGVALSVPRKCLLQKEPFPEHIRPMLDFRNVLLVPALGKSATSSHKRNVRSLLAAVIGYLRDGDLSMAVNPDVMVGDTIEAEYPLRVHSGRPTMRMRLNV